MKQTTILLLLVLPALIFGQSKGMPVNISLFNEATAIPFTKYLSTPIHPGIQMGTEFNWKQGRHFSLYPAISIGYLFHNKLYQGFFVNAEIGYDYKTGFGLNFKSKIGLGYLHTFATQQEYQFENGVYHSSQDKGNWRLMPSLTVGLGYTIRKKDIQSPEVYALYQSWIEYPYSPGFIPVMSHTNLHVGAKFYPFKN